MHRPCLYALTLKVFAPMCFCFACLLACSLATISGLLLSFPWYGTGEMRFLRAAVLFLLFFRWWCVRLNIGWVFAAPACLVACVVCMLCCIELRLNCFRCACACAARMLFRIDSPWPLVIVIIDTSLSSLAIVSLPLRLAFDRGSNGFADVSYPATLVPLSFGGAGCRVLGRGLQDDESPLRRGASHGGV